jgi:hypothetical protein
MTTGSLGESDSTLLSDPRAESHWNTYSKVLRELVDTLLGRRRGGRVYEDHPYGRLRTFIIPADRAAFDNEEIVDIEDESQDEAAVAPLQQVPVPVAIQVDDEPAPIAVVATPGAPTPQRHSARIAAQPVQVDYTDAFFDERSDGDDFRTLMSDRNWRVRVGQTLLPFQGLGTFVVEEPIARDSFVCVYGGPRYETTEEALAAYPNTCAIFDGSVLLQAPPRAVVVATQQSYGYYVNDPLLPHLVNAAIRYNRTHRRFEIWSTGNGIGVNEEVYISYSADFWRTRQHLAHCLIALRAGYPELF